MSNEDLTLRGLATLSHERMLKSYYYVLLLCENKISKGREP